MGPTGIDSLIIIRTGGSKTPGDEIVPNMPSVMPKHSISSTDDKSQPESSMKMYKLIKYFAIQFITKHFILIV